MIHVPLVEEFGKLESEGVTEEKSHIEEIQKQLRR